jgi:hypothetical protein
VIYVVEILYPDESEQNFMIVEAHDEAHAAKRAQHRLQERFETQQDNTWMRASGYRVKRPIEQI